MRRIAGAVLLALVLATTGLWFLIPEYDRPDPGQVLHYVFDPDWVVNAPLVYELLGISMGVPEPDSLRERVRLPAGFSIGAWATDLAHVRFMRFAPGGHLVVTQSMKGRVVVLDPDRDGDGASDGAHVIFRDLVTPHGVELYDGWLYVAEHHVISRVRFDAKTGRPVGALEPIARLPDVVGHSMRPVEIGPDDWLYTAIGTPCNGCEPEGPEFGTILRMRPDGSERAVYARGFRNVADFAWRPGTGEMFATEVGRDFMGHDLPPDELNRIEPSGFYGFPYLHGDGIPDPELEAPAEAVLAAALAPVHLFPAHSTPLGMTMVEPGLLSESAAEVALVALHGSWNRREKSGYEVVALRFDGNGAVERLPFARGFEHDEHVIGRPVDVVQGPDGAIYLSDDFAGAIYRIARDDE